ncbi:glycosyltransferase [Weeksellaceae bacterium TAE3-ERU29]|nr:glycosyltransferase [Weeksellaceae bacterium TAE3-ERU29]
MKRILHITGQMNRAGAETMLMNLYRNIDKSKFQFDFISFSSEKGDFDEEIKSLGGKVYNISAQNFISRMLKLQKFIKNHPEYKIIHCHTLLSNAFHLYVAKRAGIKFRITHSHNTSDKSKHKLILSIYKMFSTYIINKYTTHFIACGQAAANFLFPKQKEVLILPNSVNTKKLAFIGLNKKNYIENEFGFKGLKIIQIGRLEPVKNHLFSIRLANYMKNNYKNPFKFFFVGKGSLLNELKKEVNENNLSNQVEFLGLRSDIPELMSGADVMILPSFHEGFPVVLVESQSVGLPALISDSISSEVDLKLGLVDFANLNDSLSKWSDALTNYNKENMEMEKRLISLSNKGFDINNNTKVLEKLYNSMI